MGDLDNSTTPENTYYFYLRGTKSDGEAFNEKIELKDSDTIDNLLLEIGKAYGNTSRKNQLVDVTLNSSGEIVVSDKQNGSSKLDFHMVGAVDFDTSDGDGANVTNIDDLDVGETDFSKIVDGTSTAANNKLYVKEFVKSDLNAVTNIQGLTYDRVEFFKKGSTLSANASQIVRSDNSLATPSTKLFEVADLSQGTAGTLDGTTFKLVGTDINGNTYDVSIDLDASGSTFSPDGGATNYKIFDMSTPRNAVAADEMTYQQLMDVMNMVITNKLPASTNDADDYDAAIIEASKFGSTSLSYDGKLKFVDLTSYNTQATLSLYDTNAGAFDQDPSVMTFNTTNALSIRDPKMDFFKRLNQAISAVEEYKLYPDAGKGTPQNVGIENAIQMIDDLHEHVSNLHSKVGAQSNALNDSLSRVTLLQTSTMSLRSSVIDTDLAEASLRLTQLNTNYQAMLSTVGKISKLSLINYL
jgi:flagellar hook-associated protein 3 FlgL